MGECALKVRWAADFSEKFTKSPSEAPVRVSVACERRRVTKWVPEFANFPKVQVGPPGLSPSGAGFRLVMAEGEHQS